MTWEHYHSVSSVAEALSLLDEHREAARIVAGGKKQGNQGFFFQPTVIKDVADSSMLMTQEPFGPLAAVTPFRTFDEVVERANSLPFGLAAYAFTQSLSRGQAITEALAAGVVGLNTVTISVPESPFGGINDSGHGSEGGIEGLEAYMNVKFIASASL